MTDIVKRLRNRIQMLPEWQMTMLNKIFNGEWSHKNLVTRLRTWDYFRCPGNERREKRGNRYTYIVVDDSFGNAWDKCERFDCGLHVVRPGKVQCDAERCPMYE